MNTNYKYNIRDKVMGIQNDIHRKALFAGEIIGIETCISGINCLYKIKLLPGITWVTDSEIIVSEKFCIPYDEKNWLIARLHWASYVEYLVLMKKHELLAKRALIGKE